MAEYAALTFEEIITRISEPKNTLILFHRNPDADAVGSAYALKKILADLGSRAWCVCVFSWSLFHLFLIFMILLFLLTLGFACSFSSCFRKYPF